MKDNLESISKIAGQVNTLQQEAIRQTLDVYTSEVEKIVYLKITDNTLIERILDWLLDVAFDDDVLKLFKKLCRHYWLINPESTALYIQSYREMWDEESLKLETEQNSVFAGSEEALGYGE